MPVVQSDPVGGPIRDGELVEVGHDDATVSHISDGDPDVSL
ncbi:hypothetical protein [Nocardioides salarius]